MGGFDPFGYRWASGPVRCWDGVNRSVVFLLQYDDYFDRARSCSMRLEGNRPMMSIRRRRPMSKQSICRRSVWLQNEALRTRKSLSRTSPSQCQYIEKTRSSNWSCSIEDQVTLQYISRHDSVFWVGLSQKWRGLSKGQIWVRKGRWSEWWDLSQTDILRIIFSTWWKNEIPRLLSEAALKKPRSQACLWL